MQGSGHKLEPIATVLILTDDVLELGPRTTSKPAAVSVIAQVLPPRHRDVASPPSNAHKLDERDTIETMNARAYPFKTTTSIAEIPSPQAIETSSRTRAA